MGQERLDYLLKLDPSELDSLFENVAITELLQGMNAEEIARFLERMPEELREKAIAEMQEGGMLADLNPRQIATICTTLSPADKAKLMREMPPAEALKLMTPGERLAQMELMSVSAKRAYFEEALAGGMSLDYMMLNMTPGQKAEFLRHLPLETRETLFEALSAEEKMELLHGAMLDDEAKAALLVGISEEGLRGWMTDEMKEARLRVCTAEERIAVLSAIKPSEDVPAYLDRLHHQERLAFTLIYAE